MPPTTLEIVRRARDKIVNEPDAYEFMDYCHCLAGHVYQQATGQSLDDAFDNGTVTLDTRFPAGDPVGDAIEALLVANEATEPSTRSLTRVSSLNSRLTLLDNVDNDNECYRRAAVRALDTTITHLEESS